MFLKATRPHGGRSTKRGRRLLEEDETRRMHTEPSKFRWNYRLTTTSPGGRHVIMFRIGVGYWPCLHAPFLQIAFGKHIFEFWYGLPPYKTKC